MQWNEKELVNIINQGPKAILNNIIPYLDKKENEDIFLLDNFAYLWAILGAVNLEGMTLKTHYKIWQTLKKTNALDAHDKGMLSTFTQNVVKNNPKISQKYWLNLDKYDMRVKFCQEILWEILKNNEELTKEVAPYCLDGVRLVESLVDKGLIPQVKTYLNQLRTHGATCGISGAGVRETYEKEAVLRKVCSIVANLKRKLAFDEKEYLFNYFHEVYLDGFDATHIGLDDEMLSRLMVDEELDEVSEVEAQRYLDHNWEIANFSKELDEIYGFCENTASKLIRHDTSHLTNMIERCLSRLAIDEKPKGVLFALELVNLNQMKTAVSILIELAKKGRATEMTYFLHRILPKINGSETMIMKILKLNLQHLHLDEVIAGNTGLKEYVLRIYLNAVETFIAEEHIKDGAELLQELVNNGWFLGAKKLVYTKFIDIANKIISLDVNQKATLFTIAKKLKLKIYTDNNIISIGKEFSTLSDIEEALDKPLKESNEQAQVEDQKDIEVTEYEEAQIIENVLEDNKDEAIEAAENITFEDMTADIDSQEDVIDFTQLLETPDVEENIIVSNIAEEPNVNASLPKDEETQQNEDEVFMELINNLKKEDIHQDNTQEEKK